MASPLDCFLSDPIPLVGFAIYDVEPELRPYGIVDGRVAVLERLEDGRVVSPLGEYQDHDLDDLAWSLLLQCVTHVAQAGDERRVFKRVDLPFWDHVERDNIKLAVTEPEYFARRPLKNGKHGLMVFNPRGVILVSSGLRTAHLMSGLPSSASNGSASS